MKKFIFFIIIYINCFLIYSFEDTGVASWYGPTFHGKKTANGEIFDTNKFTAAHQSLPFGSIVKIISEENNKETIVRITDRGPFAKNRIIDLSKSAAEELDMIKSGTMKVKIVLLEKGDNKYYKYSNKQYQLQLGSFSSEDKALDMLNNLKEKINQVMIKKVILDKTYYRVITEKLSYSDYQMYRVMLHKENLKNYIVLKK